MSTIARWATIPVMECRDVADDLRGAEGTGLVLRFAVSAGVGEGEGKVVPSEEPVDRLIERSVLRPVVQDDHIV
jgi:hypothetical protein